MVIEGRVLLASNQAGYSAKGNPVPNLSKRRKYSRECVVTISRNLTSFQDITLRFSPPPPPLPQLHPPHPTPLLLLSPLSVADPEHSEWDQIISKEIRRDIIHEDELCMAFRDANPQAPVHFLVIPKDKACLNRLSSAREEHRFLLGHLLYTAQMVAHREGLVPGGFRTVINDSPHNIQHITVHVLGGRQMTWPPG